MINKKNNSILIFNNLYLSFHSTTFYGYTSIIKNNRTKLHHYTNLRQNDIFEINSFVHLSIKKIINLLSLSPLSYVIPKTMKSPLDAAGQK